MMEQLFLTAWRKQAGWLWLLLPISWLYQSVAWLNKQLFHFGLKKIYYAPIPVIVIGNITVGGSGKTPLIIALVDFLQQQNIKVGVISRGYGGDSKIMPAIVNNQSTPNQVGDEPCLIVQTTNVPMAVCANRGQAIDLLLKNYPDLQLVLADDGLQHYALDRDKDWIVVDEQRGFGNKQILPTGFLRESLSRLTQPDTTVIYHVKNQQFTDKLTMQLVEQPLQSIFSDQSYTLTEKKVIGLTGIGFPQRFFNSLQKLGFEVVEKPLNDHHHYQLADFSNLPDLPIVVTSKDAVKIRLLLQNVLTNLNLYSDMEQQTVKNLAKNIWVLPVVAELSPTVYQNFTQQLQELGIIVGK